MNEQSIPKEFSTHGREMKTIPYASILPKQLAARWLISVHRTWLKDEYVIYPSPLFVSFVVCYDCRKSLTKSLFIAATSDRGIDFTNYKGFFTTFGKLYELLVSEVI